MHDTMTDADAGRIAGRARALLRLGEITRAQYALLDALLWTCRRRGQAVTRAAYSWLQTVVHAARSTIAAGLAALERVGLIARARSRVLAIGANGGRIWKQLPNSYRFASNGGKPLPARGSDRRPDSKPQDHTHCVEASSTVQVDAREALKRARDRFIQRQRQERGSHLE